MRIAKWVIGTGLTFATLVVLTTIAFHLMNLASTVAFLIGFLMLLGVLSTAVFLVHWFWRMYIVDRLHEILNQ